MKTESGSADGTVVDATADAIDTVLTDWPATGKCGYRSEVSGCYDGWQCAVIWVVCEVYSQAMGCGLSWA